MNYNSMTDVELLHYLDLCSDDPLIRRVVKLLSHTRGALLDDLENAGMDRDNWMFDTDWQRMYPGDYIIYLRDKLDRAESELASVQDDYERLQDKYEQLSTRTIVKFIEELQREKQTNQDLVREAMTTVQAYKKENDKLKEQIDMWGRMNRVHS